MDKLKSFEDRLGTLAKAFDAPNPKRLRRKASAEEAEMRSVRIEYFYTQPETIRTRLQASVMGAQRLPRCAFYDDT